MNSFRIWSDHAFTWSEVFTEKISRRSTKASSDPSRQAASPRWHPSRFSHRTLQALWQAWLQMCQWPRSWPQVLLIRQLPEIAAASGLCSAEPSCGGQEISCPLSTHSRNLRADLRDQPRTAAPPRGALRPHDERHCFPAHRAHKFPISKRGRRQHARKLVGLFSHCFDNCGGHR